MAEPVKRTYQPMDYTELFGDLLKRLYERQGHLYSLAQPYTEASFKDLKIVNEVNALWAVIRGIEELAETPRYG